MAAELTWRGFLVALAVSITGAAAGCESKSPMRDPLPVMIHGQTFQLELALDNDTRTRGLGGRKEMADDRGMLFVFRTPQVQRFWMLDCYFPIDLIYLDAGGRVVSTHRMPAPAPEDRNNPDKLPPYSSVWPAQFVIELKGGRLDVLGLKEGEKIELPLDALKRSAR